MPLEYLGAPPLASDRQVRPFSPAVRAGDFIYVSGQVPADKNGEIVVGGIEPKLEPEVTDINGIASRGTFDKLVPGEFGIVLGAELARSLFVQPGDQVTLVAPGGQVTPAGVVPRLKQFTVVGTFDSGHYEYDSALAMVHEQDAAKVFRLEGPTGIRLKLKDLNEARDVADQLAVSLPGEFLIRDWTRQNKTWFAAVQVEKRMPTRRATSCWWPTWGSTASSPTASTASAVC